MKLEDVLIRHKILIQRLTKGLQDITMQSFDAVFKLVLKEIESNKRIKTRLLKKRLDKITEQSIPIVMQSLQDIAEYQANFIKKAIEKDRDDKLETLSEAVLATLLAKTLLKTSLNKSRVTIKKAYETIASKKNQDIIQVLLDTPNNSIAERQKFVKEVIDGRVKTQVRALANLSLNTVATEVAKKVYSIAKVEKVQWLATLDSSVCFYCESLHEKTFYIDDSPACPAHANCRCELVPYDE